MAVRRAPCHVSLFVWRSSSSWGARVRSQRPPATAMNASARFPSPCIPFREPRNRALSQTACRKDRARRRGAGDVDGTLGRCPVTGTKSSRVGETRRRVDNLVGRCLKVHVVVDPEDPQIVRLQIKMKGLSPARVQASGSVRRILECFPFLMPNSCGTAP